MLACILPINNNGNKHIQGWQKMKPEFREKILKQLRQPGRRADMLIERYLGHPGGPSGSRAYSSDVEAALTLLPEGVHFLCGRFEEGKLFWCDVGFRPQVQAWGETMAAAIAGAVFAYATYPDACDAGTQRRAGHSGQP
jgi:hypothetical protein